MAITVVGCIAKETLIFPGSGWQVQESIGGISCTAALLASLADEVIIPVCNVGSDIFDDVIAFLEEFPNVDISGIQKVESDNIHCYILFVSEYGTQHDEGCEVPITFSQVKPFLDRSRFVLISSMTGFDFTLRTLQKIKQNAKCPLYFDYHILALDRDAIGNRFLHRRQNWLKWCTSCDHLQLNQFEAELLSGRSMQAKEDLLPHAKLILDQGVTSIAVTLGPRGALIYWSEGGNIEVEWLDAVRVPNFVDATGCGDVFASGFVARFLQTDELPESYRFANRIAGLNCGFSGLSKLANISKFMKAARIPRHLGRG